eukprot:CAMPEP_0181180162 /NCGR_PEP_ID=MMETSP1096-20121128/6648_1 /TAXON_ID=156174 ORGANISM="Chrysochromulina ericina, Strain CCMP281" /NCGR_SAMPLE_ID=MMETSP1096 /ASSEMBLY_ACC=CAM_ASM_000453 /LENGTH=124 /DNA_ID=CAMNT_0023268563 /DNA_START=206 /DNA_END=579 /DNA_ORIENTATION=+
MTLALDRAGELEAAPFALSWHRHSLVSARFGWLAEQRGVVQHERTRGQLVEKLHTHRCEQRCIPALGGQDDEMRPPWSDRSMSSHSKCTPKIAESRTFGGGHKVRQQLDASRAEAIDARAIEAE